MVDSGRFTIEPTDVLFRSEKARHSFRFEKKTGRVDPLPQKSTDYAVDVKSTNHIP